MYACNNETYSNIDVCTITTTPVSPSLWLHQELPVRVYCDHYVQSLWMRISAQAFLSHEHTQAHRFRMQKHKFILPNRFIETLTQRLPSFHKLNGDSSAKAHLRSVHAEDV
jgi:hypothetical protein